MAIDTQSQCTTVMGTHGPAVRETLMITMRTLELCVDHLLVRMSVSFINH